jgi:O-antigen biosynthesis protein WbqP
MTKRMLDLAVAITMLLLTLPLWPIIALAIRLNSRGPAFFRQTRVGLEGRTFEILKFRTMTVGTPSLATHDVSPNAVTIVGRFLRQSKLDELPQMWNVVRGDMSVVGPRPCLSTQYELIAQRKKRDVFSVRPGISGLAQVHRIDMARPKRLAAVDGLYVKNQTLFGDIALLLATLRLTSNQCLRPNRFNPSERE